MNPFISFCLYVAARVFVQYLKSRPKDTQIRASLQFLLSAMQAIKRKNPLTESFLVQLDVDLEGAGLEDSRSLRNQGPQKQMANRSPGCPSDHLGMGHRQTYGDIGLASYNDPSANVPLTATASSQQPSFGYDNVTDMSSGGSMGFIPSVNQFDLPSRSAPSPASHQSSGMHRSPQPFNPDMDTSPDTSGGEHHTPNSSTQQNMSTHTSNTGYSPQNLQQQDPSSGGMGPTPGQLTGLFEPNDGTFSTDFDMHSFPAATADQQQPGFVLPSNWGTGSTGLTPGPTGLTPGTSGMGDLMGMTDADWNQMMDNMSFTDWESGVAHTETLQSTMNSRR